MVKLQGIHGWVGQLPQAGALYPIELYVATARVNSLDNGLYRYIPSEHALLPLRFSQDIVLELFNNSDNRAISIRDSAASIIISGVISRSAGKYGDRAEKYVSIEVGAVAQNIYLQARALNIGTVFIGAINYDTTKRFINESEFDITPFSVMPLGKLENSMRVAKDAKLLSKQDIDTLNEGWHLLGSSQEISDASIFDSAKVIWKYKNNNWSMYTPNSSNLFIESNSGFWVKK